MQTRSTQRAADFEAAHTLAALALSASMSSGGASSSASATSAPSRVNPMALSSMMNGIHVPTELRRPFGSRDAPSSSHSTVALDSLPFARSDNAIADRSDLRVLAAQASGSYDIVNSTLPAYDAHQAEEHIEALSTSLIQSRKRKRFPNTSTPSEGVKTPRLCGCDDDCYHVVATSAIADKVFTIGSGSKRKTWNYGKISDPASETGNAYRAKASKMLTQWQRRAKKQQQEFKNIRPEYDLAEVTFLEKYAEIFGKFFVSEHLLSEYWKLFPFRKDDIRTVSGLTERMKRMVGNILHPGQKSRARTHVSIKTEAERRDYRACLAAWDDCVHELGDSIKLTFVTELRVQEETWFKLHPE